MFGQHFQIAHRIVLSHQVNSLTSFMNIFDIKTNSTHYNKLLQNYFFLKGNSMKVVCDLYIFCKGSLIKVELCATFFFHFG